MTYPMLVIEGIDASGKGEQRDRLSALCEASGIPYHVVSYPRYGEKGCYFVDRYLNGHYGKVTNVSEAKRASLFYALDRFDFKKELEDMRETGVVILDRYVSSNYAYQAQFGENWDERGELVDWIKDVEYNILGLPKPDLVLFIHMPWDIASQLLERKAPETREYIEGGKKKDIHEADVERQRRAEETYLWLAEREGWPVIRCADDSGGLRSIDDIHREVVETLVRREVLPKYVTLPAPIRRLTGALLDRISKEDKNG